MTWGTAMISGICRQSGDRAGFSARAVTYVKLTGNA